MAYTRALMFVTCAGAARRHPARRDALGRLAALRAASRIGASPDRRIEDAPGSDPKPFGIRPFRFRSPAQSDTPAIGPGNFAGPIDERPLNDRWQPSVNTPSSFVLGSIVLGWNTRTIAWTIDPHHTELLLYNSNHVSARTGLEIPPSISSDTRRQS